MRRIRYVVATSLDGFIAGPNGEADWIDIDPEVDFAALWTQFDTGLMGRRTYEAARKRLGEAAFAGLTTIVFSRTMKQEDHPEVTVVSELKPTWVQTLQSRCLPSRLKSCRSCPNAMNPVPSRSTQLCRDNPLAHE